MLHVKFFLPASGWTWYAAEGDRRGDDFLFFGLVKGGGDFEWGEFRLSELESATDELGNGVERDRFWRPTPASEVLRSRR
ncbi:MAG: hypothetical protein Kow0069_20650 [Promethearchaeota archaeon]